MIGSSRERKPMMTSPMVASSVRLFHDDDITDIERAPPAQDHRTAADDRIEYPKIFDDVIVRRSTRKVAKTKRIVRNEDDERECRQVSGR